MTPLVIIPARWTSAGVRLKNFKELPDGTTLIDRAVKIGQRIGHVIVTTDSPSWACSYPDVTVMRRPVRLATATTPMGDVVRHACEGVGYWAFDTVVLLQPTSPFRTVRDVQKCIAKLKNSPHLDLVMTVAEVPETYRPSRMLAVDDKQTLCPVTDWAANRQEAPLTYIPTGEAYVFRREAVPFVFDYTRLQAGFVVQRTPSLNINTEADWKAACQLIQNRRRTET